MEPAELAGYESIRLFCERASDVAAGFALSEDNAGSVAEICLRLDGMPLALELAAARVGALSPAQIAERLGDCLAVLTAGSRSALDRQQTLRATLSWSHELLTIAERALFRRLAVFAGTFALEAAEEVTAGEGVDARGRRPAGATRRQVAGGDRGGGGRLSLPAARAHAPVRARATRRGGRGDDLEARHLAFYLELARAADPERAAAGPIVGLDRLAAEHDNLRAALGWALRHDPEQALALAVHMWPMWMAGSHFQEGSRWLEAALAAAPAPTAAARARLCARRAGCGSAWGERTGSASSAPSGSRSSGRWAIAAPSPTRSTRSGVYEYMAGRYDRAERLYAQSRALAEELDDRKVLAAVRHSEGVLAQCRGDFAGAREALLDSLTRLRELPAGDGDRFFRVHTVGLFVAAEGPGGAPRMYFEETVAVLSPRGRRGARSATSWPGSATSRAPRG